MRGLKQQWVAKGQGVRVGCAQPRHLRNLRPADGFLLVGNSMPLVQAMLGDIAEGAAKAGLELHMGKTKILGNAVAMEQQRYRKHVVIDGKKVEVLKTSQSTM